MHCTLYLCILLAKGFLEKERIGLTKRDRNKGIRLTLSILRTIVFYIVYLDSTMYRMMSEAKVIGIVNPISIPLFLSLFVNLILPFYLKSFWPCGI